ncbi:MAG: hypothetical protein U0I89_07530 [Prevotella sp.]|nr:hypothetical protein [Prevotella sp.]
MNTKKNENVKANMAAAASSTLGAAIGVVGGTLMSEEIHAAQVEDPVLPEDPHATDDVPIVDVEAPTHNTAAQPTVAATTSHVTPVSVEPIAADPIPEPDPIPDPEPNPEPEPDPTPGPNVMPASTLSPDVQVLDYQTITGADGQQMDAALVNISGNQALIVDADRDGVADALVADANNNGQIDNDEVVDISMHQLSMSELQAAANPDPVADPDPNVMAQNTYNSDYENNANVDDYLA